MNNKKPCNLQGFFIYKLFNLVALIKLSTVRSKHCLSFSGRLSISAILLNITGSLNIFWFSASPIKKLTVVPRDWANFLTTSIEGFTSSRSYFPIIE